MSANQLYILIEKYLDESLTAEERSRLAALLQQPEYETILKDRITEELKSSSYELEPDDAVGQRIKNFVQEQINQAEQPGVITLEAPKSKTSVWIRWVAAASVILAASLAIYYYSNIGYSKAEQQSADGLPHQDVQPGHEGAILTLANGTQVLLDTIKNGVIALQGGTTATVLNGALVYNVTNAVTEAVYNTMSTPRGRQFQLTLPDGSQVWLNSASSVTYPTVFNGTERNVEITGEAYFEIAADKKKPFIVSKGNMQVKVLGTHFNVNAYDDEADIKVTLLEGSVKISNSTDSRQMQPGQQATVIPGSDPESIKINNSADTDQVMAWKNGFFNFEGVTLTELMRQIARWYDIEVIFEPNAPRNAEFAGKATRGITLKQLVESLKELGINCRQEGRKLIVEK